MIIHNTKNSFFMLYLDSTDFEKYHIDPSSVSAEQAMDILSRSCASFSPSPLAAAEIELFPGNSDLLMFIRANLASPVFYSFDSIDDIVRAVQELPNDTVSSLLLFEGNYLLVIWPEDNSHCSISEFAHLTDASSNFALHIFEHAKKLLAGNAVSELKKIFAA